MSVPHNVPCAICPSFSLKASAQMQSVQTQHGSGRRRTIDMFALLATVIARNARRPILSDLTAPGSVLLNGANSQNCFSPPRACGECWKEETRAFHPPPTEERLSFCFFHAAKCRNATTEGRWCCIKTQTSTPCQCEGIREAPSDSPRAFHS